MDGLKRSSAACDFMAASLGEDTFTLIDVGCSSGIGPIWRAFGPRLRAWGFDPDRDECDRLTAQEPLSGVHYIPAFVGLAPGDPIVMRRRGKPYVQRNPWDRLSVTRTMALRQARTSPSGRAPRMADASAPVVLPDFFRAHAVDDIDFIKIDVDGGDFEILQSLEGTLATAGVLGVGLEVNFVGSHEDTDHTFHNTDRFMRRLGFELAHLTVRPYSLSALPARYQLSTPARTERGRPLQGDALYVRDCGDPGRGTDAATVPPAKLLKLVAIFAAFGLTDCAAEVLLVHRQRLASLLDVDRALDLLATETQATMDVPLSYGDYIAAFERDDEIFYARPRRVA